MPELREIAHVVPSNKARHDTSPLPFNDLTAALAAFRAKEDMKGEHINKKLIKQTFDTSVSDED
jgi:hypothetical protein